MGRPITQEDIELLEKINIKHIINIYKYFTIVAGIGYIYYLFIF